MPAVAGQHSSCDGHLRCCKPLLLPPFLHCRTTASATRAATQPTQPSPASACRRPRPAAAAPAAPSSLPAQPPTRLAAPPWPGLHSSPSPCWRWRGWDSCCTAGGSSTESCAAWQRRTSRPTVGACRRAGAALTARGSLQSLLCSGAAHAAGLHRMHLQQSLFPAEHTAFHPYHPLGCFPCTCASLPAGPVSPTSSGSLPESSSLVPAPWSDTMLPRRRALFYLLSMFALKADASMPLVPQQLPNPSPSAIPCTLRSAISLAKGPNGQPLLLGEGGYGKVRPPHAANAICCKRALNCPSHLP